MKYILVLILALIATEAVAEGFPNPYKDECILNQEPQC